MVELANTLQVGQRVWTVFGYADHGPMEGPKVDIQGDQGGMVVADEASGILGPFSGCPRLIVVQWDNGQRSKHYCDELFCIGPFQSLCAFEKALAEARDSVVEFGPQGGFRNFLTTVLVDGEPRTFAFSAKWTWDELLEPALRRLKKKVRKERILSARENKARERERESLRVKVEFLKFVLSDKPDREQVTRWLYRRLGKDPLEYLRYVKLVDPKNQDSQQKLSRQGESKLRAIMRDYPELAE